MIKRKNFAIIAMAASLALVGCSDTDTPEPGKSPANGTDQSAGTEEAPEPENEADPGDEEDPGTETQGTEDPGDPGDPNAEAAEIDVPPATGTTLEGSGYALSLPEGWEEMTDGDMGEGYDIIAGDMEETSDFASNVNVIDVPEEEVPLSEVESVGISEFEASGASDVKVEDRLIIDGTETARLSGNMDELGDVLVEQFYLARDGATKIVTIFTNRENPDYQGEEVSLSIMASWNWL